MTEHSNWSKALSNLTSDDRVLADELLERFGLDDEAARIEELREKWNALGAEVDQTLSAIAIFGRTCWKVSSSMRSTANNHSKKKFSSGSPT